MKANPGFSLLRIILSTIFLLAANLKGIGQVEIEGRFHNWPNDSVFIYQFSFASPYTIQTFGYPLDEEGSLSAKLDWVKEAQIIKIEPHDRAKFVEENFLGYNFTSKFAGHNCTKYYKWGSLTLFAEPNEKIRFTASHTYERIKLREEDAEKYRASGWDISQDNIWEVYGETKVYFSGEKAQKMSRFQEYLKTDFDPVIEKVKTNVPKDVWQLITIEKNAKLDELSFSKRSLGITLFDFLREEIKSSAINYYIKYLARKAHLEEISQNEFEDFYFKVMQETEKPNLSKLMGYEQIKCMSHYANSAVSLYKNDFRLSHDIYSLYTYGYADLPLDLKYQYALALIKYNSQLPERAKLASLIRRDYPRGDKNYLLKE